MSTDKYTEASEAGEWAWNLAQQRAEKLRSDPNDPSVIGLSDTVVSQITSVSKQIENSSPEERIIIALGFINGIKNSDKPTKKKSKPKSSTKKRARVKIF